MITIASGTPRGAALGSDRREGHIVKPPVNRTQLLLEPILVKQVSIPVKLNVIGINRRQVRGLAHKVILQIDIFPQHVADVDLHQPKVERRRRVDHQIGVELPSPCGCSTSSRCMGL